MTSIRAITTVCLTIATLSSALAASAHDFWLEPTQYHIDAPGLVPVSVMIGHPSDQMTWPVSADRVVALRTLSTDGVTDQQSSVSNYGAMEMLLVELDTSGLHVLTIETNRAFSDLPAAKFEDYLAEEGLSLIQLDRVQRQATERSGTELYSRRGKAILQVGPITTADRTLLRRPLGLTLEIMTLDHPLEWMEESMLNAEVLFRGAPIAGVTVGLVSTEAGSDKVVHSKTAADGTVSFAYPGPGMWMLHAVWGDRSTVSERADYNTIFSSVSFEVR